MGNLEGKMSTTLSVFILLLLSINVSLERELDYQDENDAIAFLHNYNNTAGSMFNKYVHDNWAYYSNITDYNEQKMVEAGIAHALYLQNVSRQASEFNRSGFDPDVKRQLEFLVYIGDGALEGEDQAKLNHVLASLKDRLAKGKVCPKKKDKCYTNADINSYLAHSTNYYEMYLAWKEWRGTVAAPARQDYQSYVILKNKAAKANDQNDWGAFWRSQYEEDDFKGLVESLWKQMQPYYQQLHAYVRRKLYERYGDEYVNLRGPMPAHILGNMMALDWNNLFDICQPYPGKPSIDITPNLRKQGYTPLQMFQKADEFFVSLGLDQMTGTFWHKSILEKPKDRHVFCHATAWDFYTDDDFRVIKCTGISQLSFIGVHHELGHIEYYMQYKDQPIVYRAPANPAFLGAIGDTISLSVSTPQYMYSIGLLDKLVTDNETDLNFLMKMALEKVVLLPFALTLDEWRWGVFDGSIAADSWNEHWWKLRLKYQGLVPPIARTEDDLDPASLSHVPSDIPYINYFVGHLLQFHFHKSLCTSSGHVGPLHRCDIFKSLQSGSKLSSAMSLGKSKQWKDAMEAITNVREMDATPMIEYFQPVFDYVTKVNKENGDEVGWPDGSWMPKVPVGPTTPPLLGFWEIVGISVAGGIILISVLGWFLYACTHPNSKSGLCLLGVGSKCRKYERYSSEEDAPI